MENKLVKKLWEWFLVQIYNSGFPYAAYQLWGLLAGVASLWWQGGVVESD